MSRSPHWVLLWFVVLAVAAVPAFIAGEATDAFGLTTRQPVHAVELSLALVLAGISVVLHRATGEARAGKLTTAAALMAIAGAWPIFGSAAAAAGATALAGYYAAQVAWAPQVDTAMRQHRELIKVGAVLVVLVGAQTGLGRLVEPALLELLVRTVAVVLWSTAAMALLSRWRRREATPLQAWVAGLAVAVAAGQAVRVLASAAGRTAFDFSGHVTVLAGLLVTALGAVHLLMRTLEDRRSQLHLLRVEQARSEREREDERSTFVHEVRNALMGLEAATSALRNAPALSEALHHELTGALATGIGRLRAMVLPGEDREPTAVTLAGDVVVPTVLLARARGTQILLAGELDTVVQCSPGALAQALDNLLVNAHRHGDAGRIPVEVHLQHDATRLLVRVSDRGPGIPETHREQVFHAGVRLGANSGDGIGLAVSRDLLRSCGGDLWLEPCDVGATFVAAVPIASGGGAGEFADDKRSDQLV